MLATQNPLEQAGVADGLFLHRLEQRRLRLGRRAVQLVGEQQVGEHRPLLEAEVAVPGAVVLLEQFGAEDVARHQVGGELDAAEVELERLAERAHQQGLAEAGHAFEQAMPAGEQADEQLLDDVFLADDGLRDRGLEGAEARQARLDLRFGDGLVHAVSAYMTILTPNLVLSSARKRLLRQS